MSFFHWALLAVLAIVTHSIAAPSEVTKLNDVTKLEEIANVKSAKVQIDVAPEGLINSNGPSVLADDSNGDTQGQRQKRFNNFYGYGFPPMNPVIYPYRDEQYQQYGHEDPLVQIHRRLQDIAAIARTSNYNYNLPPPPPPGLHYPLLFPVIFIPYVNCGCTPSQTPRPNLNDTGPDVSNRFPEMEDERQNWGFVVNETETDNEPEDFTRPISFEPIRPERPTNRPPPAVEHGSSQAGSNSTNTGRVPTTTIRPSPSRPSANPPRPIQNTPAVEPPSACDAAVLGCCHQPQITYDCFAVQGCPDPSSYGNPCDVQVILRVINRFQTYYGQRNSV